MESTGNDSAPVSAQKVSNKYIGYRARQIRFWTFAAVAVIVAIVAGFLGFKYSEQESAINQIDNFAAMESANRANIHQALQTDASKSYLKNIPLGTDEWNHIVDQRDAKRAEARQNSINKFSGTGWFSDLNERLEKVADKSYGDRAGVDEAMQAHAVAIYSQGCLDLKAAPDAGINGALTSYDKTTADFYKDIEQNGFQKESVAYFRVVLEDALKKGCPETSTPAVSDPLTPETKEAPKSNQLKDLLTPAK